MAEDYWESPWPEDVPLDDIIDAARHHEGLDGEEEDDG